MDLSASPLIAGPGALVTIRLELHNIGGEALEDARVQIDQSDTLAFRSGRASTGSARVSGSALLWTPGSLASGQGAVLEIRALVSPDALPGRNISLAALFSWSGGQLTSNEATISLPWALLPEAGE